MGEQSLSEADIQINQIQDGRMQEKSILSIHT